MIEPSLSMRGCAAAVFDVAIRDQLEVCRIVPGSGATTLMLARDGCGTGWLLSAHAGGCPIAASAARGGYDWRSVMDDGLERVVGCSDKALRAYPDY